MRSTITPLNLSVNNNNAALPPLQQPLNTTSNKISSMTNLNPLSSSVQKGEQTFSKLPKVSSNPHETLTTMANPIPSVQVKKVEIETNIPISSSISKVSSSPSTAVFETFEGVVQDKSIEQILLNSEFIPTDKILTKDNNGNVVCHFIKVRDHVGRASYVELDCDHNDGMGYIQVSSNDLVLTQSNDASVVPYSLKVGSFEASKGDVYGVGFECDNSVCTMTRKDSSLEPVETVFHHSKESGNDMGIVSSHPVPFPIVKMTEILANPQAVHKSIATSHNRMRNVAFNSCVKEVADMKTHAEELEKEIERFDKVSSEVSNVLSCTINDLENMHESYETRGTKCAKDLENVRLIRFNLAKRNDLTLDHIALCHSMKERSLKIAALRDELKALNDFSQTLFTGLSTVFTE